jgi:hypothetical protein
MGEPAAGTDWMVVLGVTIAGLTLLVTVVGIWAAYARRPRRALAYVGPSVPPLFFNPHPHQKLDLDLTVLLDGQPIKDPHVFMLHLVNTGNQPIRPEDFEHELIIDFGYGAEVVDVNVTGYPPSIPTMAMWSGPHIEVQPLLLNPGDTLEISGVVAQPNGLPSVTARIAGISELTALGIPRPRPTRSMLKKRPPIALLGLAAITAGIGLMRRGAPPTIAPHELWLSLSIALLSAYVALWITSAALRLGNRNDQAER